MTSKSGFFLIIFYEVKNLGGSYMNAIKFLTQEHLKVKTVLEKICDKKHRLEIRKKMFEELCCELIIHEKIEETLPSWYPQLKKIEKLDEIIRHLIKEEKEAEKAMKKFHPSDKKEEFNERFFDFKNDVEHHAAEEEKKLFPEVEKVFSSQELEEIGKEMRKYKKNLQDSEWY